MRCNDSRLQGLLDLDDTTSEYRTVATHVESCVRCQQRLLEMSSDNDFLHELRDSVGSDAEKDEYPNWVGSSVSIVVESGAVDGCFGECEPVSLEFLAPPSHPEMLGRIGRYEVERMIGSGGMGIVLKGFDTELHRVVAIKVLKPHLAHVGAARHRFAREAQSAAAVVHDHVVPIYDVQSEGELPYLVMQFVPGQSLQARVEERGPLPPREILRIAMQAAAGLAAAHQQGLVHRDVKPANILLEESVERVLISDFGLARTVDDATLTRTGIVAGTPHYMSPEQAAGQSVDHRSDLFSLGSVIYFMCAGRPPYRAEHALAVLNRICHDTHRPVDEINGEIPGELAELVDQLLAKRPADRFRDAREVELRLSTILAQIQKGKISRGLRWRRQWLRRKSMIQQGLVAACLMAVCILLGMGISRGLMSGDQRREGQMSTDKPEERASQLKEQRPEEKSGQSRQFTNFPTAPKIQVPAATPDQKDRFSIELQQLQAEVDRIEAERRLSTEKALAADSANDSWLRELHQIEATLKSLEQPTAVPGSNYSSPVSNERFSR